MREQREQSFDVTARKLHQAACVIVVVGAYVIGPPVSVALLAAIGVILLGGRFWWPLDVFRQIVWRILEPAGIVRRRDVQEDHETRRIARVLGGAILLAAAVLVREGQSWAWVGVALIAVMIALDAGFDFCALCAMMHRLRAVQVARQH
jgi:hypothetical protein